jgi:hypothetical protein
VDAEPVSNPGARYRSLYSDRSEQHDVNGRAMEPEYPQRRDVEFDSPAHHLDCRVRYRLTGVDGNGIDGMTLMDQTINTTFSPGLNTSYLGVNTNLSLASGVYTFVMTATAQGETSMRSTTFLVAGGGAATSGLIQRIISRW